MALRLGTIAPVGFEDFPPETYLGCFRRLGCTAVQAYRNEQAGITAEQIRDAVAVGGMPCDSLHGLFGADLDPSSTSEKRRRRAVETYKSEGELALSIGRDQAEKCELVVVHCSPPLDSPPSAHEHSARLDALRKSVEELGRFGRETGVRYAFENLPPESVPGANVAELAELLTDVSAPNTGMCFDSAHADLVSNAVDALRQTNGRMIYLHLTDHAADADDHEMLTQGSVDHGELADAVSELGFDHTMMLEVFRPVEYLEQLIDDGLGERLQRFLSLCAGKYDGKC
ncbi:MAG: sugar phosphate isomerase/epimerase family protein [Planctomycetota bacterium]